MLPAHLRREWRPYIDRASCAVAIGLCLPMLAGCGSSKGPTTNTGTTSSVGSGGGGTVGAAKQNTHLLKPAPHGAQGEISPGVVSESSGAVVATLHATTHHPHVNQSWPISFLVSDAGKPAHAEVAYEYLFGGQVVAHRSHYKFTGTFHDIFKWPSSAVGFPLTFRAVITRAGATLNLDYSVQVVG